MPLGAATEALVQAVIELGGQMGGEAIRHYFGWKGCAVVLLALVAVGVGLYFLLA